MPCRRATGWVALAEEGPWHSQCRVRIEWWCRPRISQSASQGVKSSCCHRCQLTFTELDRNLVAGVFAAAPGIHQHKIIVSTVAPELCATCAHIYCDQSTGRLHPGPASCISSSDNNAGRYICVGQQG